MNKILAYIIVSLIVVSCSLSDGSEDTNSVLSGSYSRLLTIGNYLYAINNENLATFDVKDKASPVLLDNQNVEL